MPPGDHHSILTVTADGQEIEKGLVREVVVRDNLSTPDTAVVTLTMPSVGVAKGEAKPPDVLDDAKFDPGNSLVVKAGAMNDAVATTIFDGTITALEPEFGTGVTTLTLRAYDKSFFMKQEPRSRTWQSQSIKDIAKAIFSQYGLSPDVEPTLTDPHDYLFQAYETDWDFLQRLARKHNLELLVSGSKASLKKVARDRDDSGLRLYFPAGADDEPGIRLLAFSPRATLAQQPGKVAVRYWDSKTKETKVAEAQPDDGQALAKVGITPSKLRGQAQMKTLTVASRPSATMQDAKARAESLLARAVDAAIEATGTAMGDPRLKAGIRLEIDGVSARFSGTYTLSSTTHTYRAAGGYRTKIQISGRNSRDLVELLGGGGGNGGANGGGREWAKGLVVGIVTNVDDKEAKQGRVRVKFPELSDQEEGWWARIATMNAGKERGIFFRPEVDDEVVVGFEHGDITRPYVLGSVFNGVDVPGSKLYAGDKNKEHDGSLLIESHKKFVMNSKDKIEITTGKTHSFKSAEDSAYDVGKNLDMKVGGDWIMKTSKTITIETGRMQKVVIKAGGDLELQAATPTGKVKITGGQVDISGQMGVNVKGMSINLG